MANGRLGIGLVGSGMISEFQAKAIGDLDNAVVTGFFDMVPELAVARKTKGRDRYERDLSLLGRVRDSYVHQAEQAGWVRVDGDRGKADIAAEISAILGERLSPA